jgi:phosphosulfolactate synthase (CoM biosynthesis protein A)
MMTDVSDHPTDDRPFGFLRTNERPSKPRTRGMTEIRGPYYTPMGKRYLQDVLETMGTYVDGLKFAGGSFSLMPRQAVCDLIELCHAHDVLVSTGGFMERVLTQGPEAVDRYIQTCKALGFDIIELSAGFITLPTDDWLRLVEKVQQAGLKAKPEIGIQFGAAATPRRPSWKPKARGLRSGPSPRASASWRLAPPC